MPRRQAIDIEARLAELQTSSRGALLPIWRDVMKKPVPPRISREMLVRILAWHIQAQAKGGLKPRTQKRLKRIAQHGIQGVPASSVSPGTRLVREWNGVSHVVDVTDTAIMWRGQTFSSLSAVARAITGAHWSGPRFFGTAGGKRSTKGKSSP